MIDGMNVLGLSILIAILSGCGDSTQNPTGYADTPIQFGVANEAAAAGQDNPIVVDSCSFAWTDTVVRATVKTQPELVGDCVDGTQYEPHWVVELENVDTIAGEDLGDEYVVRLNQEALVGEPQAGEQMLLSLLVEGEHKLVGDSAYIGSEATPLDNERGLESQSGGVDVQLSSNYGELKEELSSTRENAEQVCEPPADSDVIAIWYASDCEPSSVNPNNSSPG